MCHVPSKEGWTLEYAALYSVQMGTVVQRRFLTQGKTKCHSLIWIAEVKNRPQISLGTKKMLKMNISIDILSY